MSDAYVCVACDGPYPCMTHPHAAAEPATAAGGLHVRLASSIVPKPVRWLWHGRLAYSKLNILGGPPGVGKSYITAALAAAVSTGSQLPGDDRNGQPPAAVLMLSYEDDPEDTTRPRLDALHADLDRVELIEGVTTDDGRRTFTPADVPVLAAYLEDRTDVGLVVVDPVSAYVGAGTDEHRANEVRAALEDLRVLAQARGVCVLLVMHTRKSQADTALNRLAGSQAYGALVRSALMAGPIPDDEDERHALAHVKHNLSAKQPTLCYSVDADGIRWHGEIDLDADQVAGNNDGSDRSAGDEARSFLRETLADGPLPAVDVLEQARQLDIAKNTLHRAKKALGVDSVREGGRWLWTPPTTPRYPTSPGTQPGNLGDLGDVGPVCSGCGKAADRTSARGTPWCSTCWQQAAGGAA